MIVVDTSVWVDYLRDPKSRVRVPLDAFLDDEQVLLPAPVRVELLSGAGAHTVPMLNRTLGALEQLVPSADTWRLAQQWAGAAATKGLRFGLGDILIAACAAERGAQLWSLDRDFEPLRRLRWVKLYEARR